MGPYCNYCDMRCFVPRVLRTGESVILATCQRGMDNDLARTGQTHATAANPVTQQTEVFRIAVNPEPLTPASFCPFCNHHTAAHTHSAGADDVPCVGCKGGLCRQPPSAAADADFDKWMQDVNADIALTLGKVLDTEAALLRVKQQPGPEIRTCP